MAAGLFPYAVLGLALSTASALPAQTVLYHSQAFTITDSSVRQGRFEAVARTRDTIVSSYPRSGREVHYKFSINSEDNEFPPGTEHTLFLRPRAGRIATPVHTFGLRPPPHVPTPEESGGSEEGVAQVTFRVDMRPVLRALRDRGSYAPPNGPPIKAADFKTVYVIGDAEPLTWNARSLRPGSPLELTDPDRDSIYTVTLPIEATFTRPLDAAGRAIWTRHADLSRFPQLTSPQRLLDALYRMSLEELQQLVRPDGALSAGAKWEGVWTRDIALSSVLALAFVAPDAVRTSLLAKVDPDGRIIQDTGTGGSWPISTDRMAWALAAWEVYGVTGDHGWLRKSYDIIRRSAEADLHAAVDPATGLFHGESSFLDWRDQSYPRWMDPKDIYQSENLGTNAVHFATYRILADMAGALGEPAARWTAVAETVQRGMNSQLWQPDRGWYGQYRYGRNFMSVSPRAEGLGEALAVIYGAATPAQRKRLLRSAPLVAFGTPTFWPYIPDMPLYHNASIWPFVSAYWTWAAAESGNTSAVEHGLASIYRPAALFLTNKENMVAATGHFEGTVLNSDRQLWSVAGNLATVYRVLFGMRIRPDRLAFQPMVPPSYGGERTLRNLRYRGAVLAVTVRGFGDAVKATRFDGRRIDRAEISDRLTGSHVLEIEMNGRWPAARINLVDNRFSPANPVVALRGDTLVWSSVPGAVRYHIYRNGRAV
ncbi:MAG: glycogen debranching protein, partial [Gemmatimonadales bacterium]